MLTYGQSEELLAWLCNASRSQSTFRARLKHLKKLGVPLGITPGTGAKILYGKEEIFQWAFCLELMQFGIDPNIIVERVKQDWRKFFRWMESTEPLLPKRERDQFVCFIPEAIRAATAPKMTKVDAFSEVRLADRDGLAAILTNPHFHRAGVINISETVRILLRAWPRSAASRKAS